MITSTSNSKVQWIRSLQRRRRARQQEGAFVIEGTRLTEEAFRAGVTPRLVVHGPRLDQRTSRLVDGFARRGVPLLPVSDHVLAACASTEAPQGLLAVVSFPEVPVPARLRWRSSPTAWPIRATWELSYARLWRQESRPFSFPRGRLTPTIRRWSAPAWVLTSAFRSSTSIPKCWPAAFRGFRSGWRSRAVASLTIGWTGGDRWLSSSAQRR